MNIQSRPRNNRPSVLPVVWLLLATTTIGMLAGLAWLAVARPEYESNATFRIYSKQLNLSDVVSDFYGIGGFNIGADGRHDKLIVQESNVIRCLEIYQLYNLKSFEEIPRDDIAQWVQEHLFATQDPEEPSLFYLSIRTPVAEDSSTVVNNLIRSYKELLEKDERDVLQSREIAIAELKGSGIPESRLQDAKTELMIVKNEGLYNFQLLQNASKGERVQNFWHNIGWWSLAGFVIGIAIVIVMKSLRFLAS